MARITRGKPDPVVETISHALDLYEHEHPTAAAELYRQNNASIRVRVVDERFARMSRPDRHDEVWGYLEARLDEDAMQEISLLLLLTPHEQASSIMNEEFDHPVESVV